MEYPLDSPSQHAIKSTEIKLKTQPRKKFRSGVSQHFKDYCNSCGLHGMNYFGQDRTWIEYIWWITVFTLAVCGFIFMIYGIIIKWIRTPVLVSFATKKTPLYDVPFPAITICPLNKIDRSYFNMTKYKLGEYHEESSNQTLLEEKQKAANYMGMMCTNFPILKQATKTEYLDPEDLFSVIHKHRPKLRLMGFSNTDSFMTGIPGVVQETITQQGLCYTHNRMRLDEIYTDIVVKNERQMDYYPRSTWNPATGYRGTSNISSTYPRRATRAGTEHGLFIVIFDKHDDVDYECENIFKGFSVTLHYAGRIPRTIDDFFLLPANDIILVPIHTSIILTSSTVKSYDPAKRDCYFPNERNLKFFRSYTQKNCEMECLTNVTLEGCGCVEFYMPRENGTKICGPAKKPCIVKVKDKKSQETIQKKLDEEYGMTDDEKMKDVCNCLPMCTDINYKPSIEPLQIRDEHMLQIKKAMHMPEGENDTNQVTGMLLYFKDDKLETTERNELYGPTDFIANFGGLLGLFTGFSLLSCMEIVYYLTLRIYGNIRLFGHWAGLRNDN